jgi:hypothetical protein
MNRTLSYASTHTRNILSASRPAIAHAYSPSLHPRRIPRHVLPPIRSISMKKKMQYTDHLPPLEGQSSESMPSSGLSREQLLRLIQSQHKEWNKYQAERRRKGEKRPKLKNMESDKERQAKEIPFPVKRELGSPHNTRFVPPESRKRPLKPLDRFVGSRTRPSSYLLTEEIDRPLGHIEADKLRQEGNMTAEKILENCKI